LTVLELPNLFALLDLVQSAGDVETTIGLATSLYGLLQNAGKLRMVERIGQVRDAAAANLGDTWNHARFEAARTRIDQQLASGRLREAVSGAQHLLASVSGLSTEAYPEVLYDQTGVCLVLAGVLSDVGQVDQALPLLVEALTRCEAIGRAFGNAQRTGCSP